MRKFVAYLTCLPVICSVSRPQDRLLTLENAPPHKAERRALLVGNNAYQRARPLQNAVKDARDIEAAVKTLGFSTTLVTDAKAAEMREALQKFSANLAPGDLAFFYYAGHGVQIDGVNYMAPIDISAASENDARRTGIDVAEAQSILQRSGAGLTIMAIDACRNNPLGNQQKGFLNGFAPMRTGAGGLIAFSTGPGQTAADGTPGENGLYASFLLKVLSNPLPVIGVFRRVRDLVFEASQGNQRPYVMEDVIGDYYLAAASPQIRPAQQASPDSPASRDAQEAINRGMRLYHQGDYPAAAEAFEQARRIRPTDAYAYNAAGLANAKQGKFQIAADLFSKAISINPAYAAAYTNRGLIYLSIPNYQLAVQDFSWTIDFDPSDPVALTQRGRAYLGMREYESAAADYRRALELYPDDFEAHHGLGIVYYRLNNLRESLTQLTAAIAGKSDFVEAYEDRARTYKALGMAPQADQDQQRAARLRGH
jgi:uncharacterized caspase-like protein